MTAWLYIGLATLLVILILGLVYMGQIEMAKDVVIVSAAIALLCVVR